MTLTAIMEGMLNSRATLITEVSKLHKAILRIARADGVCVRLMTAPGVGALTALIFKTASRSRAMSVHCSVATSPVRPMSSEGSRR